MTPGHDDLNLLPADGEVIYFGKIFEQEKSDSLLMAFRNNIEWKNDEAVLFGKKIITKRKAAWYGDEPFKYTYSRTTKTALPWTKELEELKKEVEQKCGESFNSCLLNLYHNGSEAMGWHSDAEKDLKKNGTIASVSLGAERKFSFKHKENVWRIDITLEHGSLLLMKGETQTHWLHSLPPTKKVRDARISLTFRTIVK